MGLIIRERYLSDVCVMKAAGYIDASTVSDMEDKISSAYLNGKFKVVVDLTEVDFVSSAGWGVLLSNLVKMRESGGDIRVSGMADRVSKVFVLMQFDNLIDAYATDAGAVQSYGVKGG